MYKERSIIHIYIPFLNYITLNNEEMERGTMLLTI